jgi:hypothetical protein
VSEDFNPGLDLIDVLTSIRRDLPRLPDDHLERLREAFSSLSEECARIIEVRRTD